MVIEDNMLYLNHGLANANPDLGLSAAYNDGTYQHTGIFRDATDGYWKMYDHYTFEPDASIYIDTSHASFRIGDCTANIATDLQPFVHWLQKTGLAAFYIILCKCTPSRLPLSSG